MGDVRYDRDEWLAALVAAEENDWCETDSAEKHGPLAAWICDVYGSESVGQDQDIISAAMNALRIQGEDQYTPDRLIRVIESNGGEVWLDDTNDVIGLRDGEILAEPEGTASMAAYRFDTTKW